MKKQKTQEEKQSEYAEMQKREAEEARQGEYQRIRINAKWPEATEEDLDAYVKYKKEVLQVDHLGYLQAFVKAREALLKQIDEYNVCDIEKILNPGFFISNKFQT